MTRYRIFIPDWHPSSTNKLLENRWSAARKKKVDAKMIWVYCSRIPKATQRRFLSVALLINGKGRSPDPDNITKSLFDGLKQCGMIIDDSEKWLEWERPKIIRPAISKGTDIYLMDI